VTPNSLLLHLLALSAAARGRKEVVSFCESHRAAIDADPSLLAWRLRAIANREDRSMETSEQQIREIVAAHPDLPLPRLALARLLIENGRRYAEAAELIRGVLADEPGDCLALSLLALAELSLRQNRAALAVIDEARTCSGWTGLDYAEKVAGIRARATDRAVLAYERRAATLGKRSYPRMVRFWATWWRSAFVAMGFVAALAAAIDSPWLAGLVSVGVMVLNVGTAHVLESWRPHLFTALAIGLVWVGVLIR
jgi:hypothetical protein